MDKTNIVNTFTEVLDQLRNTECSQKEKIACFQRIAECIISPSMTAHINYATFCSKAVNILLLFCEDLDSVVRISAEENLNKIFRVMEKSRINRILMDLYGEIKRNGNQRSLRICLRIFGYYAPQIREHNIRWYAQNLLPCMKVISKRKETLLQETLSEFVIKFGKNIQQGLTDSETCKLFEVFIENIGSECAVKRRCTAQNCTNLLEYACNKILMAKYALNKVIDILLNDQQTNTVIGILGFLRQLVVIVIKNFKLHDSDTDDTFSSHKNFKTNNSEESRQLLEIYDYCLYLVSSTPITQHSIINAALDVINSILQSLDGLSARDMANNPHVGPVLLQFINDRNLKHVSYLKSKSTLKHQIFKNETFDGSERNVEKSNDNTTSQVSSNVIIQQSQQGLLQYEKSTMPEKMTSGVTMQQQQQKRRQTARSISECVDTDYVDEEYAAPPQRNENDDKNDDDDDADDDDGDFTTLSEMSESLKHISHTATLLGGNIDFTTKTSSSVINETISGHVVGGELELKFQGGDSSNLLVNFSSDDEKSIQLCHTDNESVNSIEFKAGISRGLVVDGVHSDSMGDDVFHTASAENIGTSQNAAATGGSGGGNGGGGSVDGAFTTFFNNINAASESVTKLFRTNSTSSKKVVSPTNTADSVSMVSDVSSIKRIETEVEIIEDSSPESSKTFPTPSTAIMGEIRSLDSLDVLTTNDVKQIEIDTPRRVAKNPFLKTDPFAADNSITMQPKLPLDIGSIYDQTLVFYTARLISARFLLSGHQGMLYNDSSVRVSIKNICLNVISQCVRLSPDVLEISLKFIEAEKHLPPQSKPNTTPDQGRPGSPIQISSDSSSYIGQDYEHLDITVATGDYKTVAPRKLSFTQMDIFRGDDSNEEPLMDIIDDHFGKSTNDFNFTKTNSNNTTTMTRSADPVLIRKSDDNLTNSPTMKIKNEKLYTSEIISKDIKLKDFVEINKADEDDMPPEMDPPPKPPKRTKTFRKSKAKMDNRKVENHEINMSGNGDQYLYEILLFYNHEDPILRAGIQSIIGHYCRSTQAGIVMETKINLQYLLAILCEGLQDDIHTVVIQALNTFDKIFPYVLFKYMATPSTSQSTLPAGSTPPPSSSSSEYHKSCCGRQQKHSRCDSSKKAQQERHSSKEEKSTCKNGCVGIQYNARTEAGINLNCMSGSLNDNDGIITTLLNAFQFQAKFNNNGSSDSCQPIDTNNHITNIDITKGGIGGGSLSGHCSLCASHHSQNGVYVCATLSDYFCSTSYCCDNSYSNKNNNNNSILLFISPKLLLNKLRLCHYNKYWLVQNKYAEVISNLSYATLRSYYGNNYTINNNHRQCCCCCICTKGCCGNDGLWNEDDVDGYDYVCGLENSFIDELLQLIDDDDVRVRECAAKCLCRFILHTAKLSDNQPEKKQKTFIQYGTDENVSCDIFRENMKMLQNFIEYSVFNDMSPTLRFILNPQQQRQLMDADILRSFSYVQTRPPFTFTSDGYGNKEIEVVLSKVLYRLTNKIMSLKDKNVQFGVIFCIKELLKYFPYADYVSSWSEFNFMEIVIKLSQFNYNTAVDLTCQSDLMDVSSKLIVASTIYCPDAFKENQHNTLLLLRHIMKIINIYYHVFTNQKPLIMAKSQKVEIFSNAKEMTATTQCLGYFGNEYIYLRLYQMLKSAYDNYKITINEEAGSKLIFLLKTCLNSLSVCIEMLPHEMAAINIGGSGGAVGTSNSTHGSTTSTTVVGVAVALAGIGKSATDVNATTTTSPSASSSSSASHGAGSGAASGPECITVLKLIEETLQYLTKVINYAPEESIACLRQLLKYLFARNYGNRQQQQVQLQQQHYSEYSKQCHYPAFIKSYITAKRKELHGTTNNNNKTNTTDDAGVTLKQQQVQTNNQPSSSSFAVTTTTNATSPTTTTTSTQLFKNQQAILMDVNYPNVSGKGLIASKFSSIGVMQDDYPMLAELFGSCLEYNSWKSRYETELSKHIKLFEPLVMHCLTLFLKCNGRIQANILDLLVTLLDFNVTYSILDSKNIIFDHITKSLDNIESGIARNGLILITPMIKFLIKLSAKNERNLISIPKIISIINNLMANYNIRDVAIHALKTLTFEIFLNNSTTKMPSQTTTSIVETVVKGTPIQKRSKDDPNSLAGLTETLVTLNNNELDTQKEVILGMLDKFIESTECQQVLSLLMLIEQLQEYRLSSIDANINIGTIGMVDNNEASCGGLAKDTENITTCLPNPDTVCNMICSSICSNRLYIQDWNSYCTVDTFFKNNTKYLLGNSKEFMSLLKYIIEGDVANFSDLSYATIILSNVILKTEEIYLVNHIKLYLKNHPTTVEKLEQKQQLRMGKQNMQQQQLFHANVKTQQQRWLLDVNSDKPSTSSAAAKAAAFAAFDTTSSSGTASALNEYNYFPNVLCDVLHECLQTLADHRRNANVYSHQYATEYCRLVCNFVRVLNKLCFNTRLEDMPLVTTIRSILNACESKLLNEYYNLLMMYSTQGCPNSANTSNTTNTTSGSGISYATGTTATASSMAIGSAGLPSSSASSLAEYVDDSVVLQLQLEMFKLLNSVGVLDTLTLLQHLQSNGISNHVRRALLNKLCHQSMPYTVEWNLQQVQHLFYPSFLNILIVDQFTFLCNLCELDEEFCALFQAIILANVQLLNKHSIMSLLRLVEYLCKKTEDCSIVRFAKFLQILNKLHKCVLASLTPEDTKESMPAVLSWTTQITGPLQLQIERLVRHLIVNSPDAYDKNAIYDTFVHLIEEEEEQQQMVSITKDGTATATTTTTVSSLSTSSSTSSYLSEHLQFMILNDLEKSCETRDDDGSNTSAPQGSAINIIDEKWIFNQLIKFSAQNNYDPLQIVKILVEIQSENKLQKIFNNGNFDAARILKHTISHSLQAMLQTFRNNCIQYNPHIHYMRPNPLVRVSLSQLMTRIEDVMTTMAMAMPMMHQCDARGTNANNTRSESDIKATVTKDINDATLRDATVVADAISGDADGRRRQHLLYLPMHLCGAVIALMENIKQIEVTALIYIESKFIDKFLSEHLLRPEYVVTLVRFIGYCCQCLLSCLGRDNRPVLLHSAEQRNTVTMALQCIHIMLHQKFIWNALNQQSLANKVSAGTTNVGATTGVCGSPDAVTVLTKCELNKIICSLLDVVSLAGTLLLENTLFYKKYKNALSSVSSTTSTAAASSSSSTSPSKSSIVPDNNEQQLHRCLHYQYHDCSTCGGGGGGGVSGESCFDNVALLTAKYNPIAIFLGKLIETKIGNYDKGIYFGEYFSSSTYAASSCAPESIAGSDVQDLKGINNQFDFISLNTLISIGISTLRTNLFYAMAVTPLEIMQQQQHLQTCHSATTSPTSSPRHKSQANPMLPIIPIESLSDVDILKSFVKRLSIFGFTTRQQFEEYFMTFLLLINKVYDENMVDQQEQFQIRSTCLEAIMELLITYKTFPIVGNKLSLYHHTTRWNRINCDSISLKKLHEIQLIISPSNVFYHSNLERNVLTDTVIGTQYYGANQFDVNFMWQQMENSSLSPQLSMDESDNGQEAGLGNTSVQSTAKHLNGIAAHTAFRNYQYFTRQSGVDYKSSSQLIFDVLMQMIEQNHILILPNLVKFTEICENREQIKQIWEKADYLKSHIPMDDTISHQHLIYLLCKTKGMLIPTHLEMLNLESLIKNYLKSSHLFVRCAALNGLLSLLESYAKTNTTIGKLSDELIRLKDIILSYIDRHGLIEESPLQCSDLHTKLIWTLNYSLMEWTSKLDSQCNMAYHTKLTVNRLLKNSTNEQVYLCVLHGLERIIVLDNKVSSNISHIGNTVGGGKVGGDSQNQMLRPSIEKLALELAKMENEKFSIPALKLLLSCIYVGSSKQLENTELSNGIVQDDPEIIAQQTDKVDILLQCIKTANEEAAWIYGQVLCQMIRDLVPPKEILTKVIKEFLAINQPHSDVIAMIVFQVFRSAIDSSFLQQLQDWLTCSLPTFLSLPQQKAVWCLSVVFLSASINLHLMKLFPLLLSGVKAKTVAVTAAATTIPPANKARTMNTAAASSPATTPTTSMTTTPKRMSSMQLGHHEISLFVTSAQDFYAKLGAEQKLRFREAFKEFHHIKVYSKMLQSL